MNAPVSAIRVCLADGRARVRYQRPDLGRLLSGKPADQALALIPTLLPVCGHAQHIAATRALEAARGQEETDAENQQRGTRLIREQAQAAAWRLLVDWPRANGEASDLHRLKALRSASDGALADGLEALLPPWLTRAREPEALRFLRRGKSPTNTTSSVERCLQNALEMSAVHQTLETLSGPALWERARGFLGSPLLTTNALGLSTTSDPIAVGPLAMHRHPTMTRLASQDLAPVPRLLLAALLDTLHIVEVLRGMASSESSDLPQRSMDVGVGVGFAMTARGPLYHMIALDHGQRVVHWRYLAPTDWHCAAGGLVDRLARGSDDRQLRLLMLAADPCAPWSVDPDTHEEAA